MIVDIRTRSWTGKDPLTPVCFPARARSAPTPAEPDASRSTYHRATAIVDAAVLVGWRADRCNVHIAAESIAALVHEAPERLLGFAPIDPTSDTALDDIDAALDLGLSGLTYAPADQGCRPTDDRALAVLEKAASKNLPVLVSNPCLASTDSVLDFARPVLLDEAARTLPDLTLILGDIGYAWADEAILMALRHERVFVEISSVVARPWALYSTLTYAYERGATNKLLFASGFPYCTPEHAIENIYTVNAIRGASSLPGVPRETLRAIIERDTLHALGIEPLPQGATVARDDRAAAPAPAAMATNPANE
ncbi:MAG: hypothetical protein EA379_02405 [Phycisphaerales bacterium]|nr:MAG: hypothetical protein EA379_02405 [Phycisphaerales bacterium]